MSQRRGCAGVGPLIGRAVRDARARKATALGTALLYASAARHSQSAFNRRRGNTLSTPSSETKFWSALRPPLVSQCKSDFVCVVYFPHLNPSLPKIYAEQKSGPSGYPDCEENCENCVVNKVKMASTRSKTRLRECNTAEESTIADSGLCRSAGPHLLHGPSYSESRRAPALIPMSGG
ncbi:hypothetical protein EVAR_68020_1 [Eumeta japonica]|uniref:Uncharacterized protein n=1 Tax=Eumeta variegata TaxID=151549 RepID=A0A4C1SUE9_EUMVA|nr:hypothetical protein EVAR_68020_1 [Eumeta japonica]